jgi:hypothetical protein
MSSAKLSGRYRRYRAVATSGAYRGELSGAAKKRLLAHPPELSYPCYVSVLGELAKIAPREEPCEVYR